MDRNGGPRNTLTIYLLGRLYLAIIMYRYGGTKNNPYYSLSWMHLSSHYNGQIWISQNSHYYSLTSLSLHRHFKGPLWRLPNCPYYSLALGLYLAIIMDLYGRPQIPRTIALLGGL
jgi:hypothetical protein